MYGFGTAGKTAITEAINAVLHNNSLIGAVFRCCIRPGSLAALQHNGIIINLQITVLYQHILADININGICTGCLHGCCGREDTAAQIFYLFTAVQMVCPEMGILQPQIRYQYIFTVGKIYQSGTLLVLIGTFRVPCSAQSECFPGTQSVSIYRTGTAHGKSIQTVRIYQCCKIGTGFSLNSGFQNRIICNIIAAL